MKTSNLISSATSAVLVSGGAIAAQELGSYVPSTVDPMYVNAGKLLVGALLPTFVKGKSAGYVKDLSAGIIAEGALQLYASFKAGGAVAGWDQAQYALGGYDQFAPALRGEANPMPTPQTGNSVATA